MSDLAKYTQARAERDRDLSEGLESGYIDFKVGALIRQAREKAGFTQEQVAERLEMKKSAISRIEKSAGNTRFSTLERYARAISWQLASEFRPPEKAPAVAARWGSPTPSAELLPPSPGGLRKRGQGARFTKVTECHNLMRTGGRLRSRNVLAVRRLVLADPLRSQQVRGNRVQ